MEFHEQTGRSYDEVIPTPVDELDMQWTLKWNIGNVVAEQYLVLQLEIKPEVNLAEMLRDIWVTLGFISMSFKSSKGNTKRIHHDSNAIVLVTPIKLTSQADKCYCCHIFGNEHVNKDCLLPQLFIPLPKGGTFTFSVHLLLLKYNLMFGNKLGSLHKPKMGAMLSFSEEESKNKFSDVTLVATPPATDGDEAPTPVKFYAHKVVLAAHSPVFAKMLEHEMKEGATDEVTIPDVEPVVLKEMLTFMYTNRAPNIKDFAYPLLYAADKYQVDQLVTQCEHTLSCNLSVENSVEYLLLADTQNAPYLKKTTMQYIAEHGEEVMKLEGWDKVKECAELLNELLQIVFKYSMPPPAKKRRVT